MSSQKCISCGLVNFAEDETCRRCGQQIGFIPETPKPLKGSKPSGGLYYYVLIGVAVIVGVWYFSGHGDTAGKAETSAASAPTQVAAQPAPTLGPQTRSEYEQERKGTFQNAIKNSDGVKGSEQHTQEVNRMMAGNTQ